MRVMNRRLNLPNMQKVLMEFEKQNERMEMTSDMMGDALDDAMEARRRGAVSCACPFTCVHCFKNHYVHACVCVYNVRAGVRVWVGACMRVRACVRATCVHNSLHACVIVKL
jgi:hypothetical protein